MRVFVDTNVLVAAVLSRGGLSADLIARLLERHTIVVSPQVLDELANVLPRCGLDARTTADAVAFVEGRAQHVKVTTPSEWHCRDTDDDEIVAAAIGCDALVTGDRDLLDGPPAPLPIMDPRTCWSWLDQVEARPKR